MKDNSDITFGLRGFFVYPSEQFGGTAVTYWEGAELWGTASNLVANQWADDCFTDAELPCVVLDLGIWANTVFELHETLASSSVFLSPKSRRPKR